MKKNSINALEVMTVKSFIVHTFADKFLLIGCTDCLSKAAKGCLLETIFFGCWGFPAGPIKTIEAIGINIKTIKQKKPSKILMKLIKDNASYIKLNLDNNENLYQLITNPRFIKSREYDLEKEQYYRKIEPPPFPKIS
jgi:hypothetical protein